MASVVDKYPNVISDVIQESVAGTTKYDEQVLGVTLFDRSAIIIQRLEYSFESSGLLVGAGDRIKVGVSVTNQIANPGPTYPGVVDMADLRIVLNAIGQSVYCDPIIHDFSRMAGDGLIVAPKPLYFFCQGSSLASTITVYVRMYFLIRELKDAEYIELFQTRQFYGIS